MKAAFSFKSQGTENIELFPQGTDDSINLRYESLITGDYKYEKKFQFCFLVVRQIGVKIAGLGLKVPKLVQW